MVYIFTTGKTMTSIIENLTVFKVKQIFKELSKKDNCYCEKRIVYELAKILEQLGYYIFFEYPQKYNAKRMYEDIRVEAPNGIFIFEIKYCPSNIKISHGTMTATSRSNSPAEKRALSFIQDIERTQKIINENTLIEGGFCVFITNQNNIIERINERQKEFCSDLKWEFFRNNTGKSGDFYLLLVPICKNNLM